VCVCTYISHLLVTLGSLTMECKTFLNSVTYTNIYLFSDYEPHFRFLSFCSIKHAKLNILNGVNLLEYGR